MRVFRFSPGARKAARRLAPGPCPECELQAALDAGRVEPGRDESHFVVTLENGVRAFVELEEITPDTSLHTIFYLREAS